MDSLESANVSTRGSNEDLSTKSSNQNLAAPEPMISDSVDTTYDNDEDFKKYLEKRKKNNEAAKRSRDKRRLNDMMLESRLQHVAFENCFLKTRLDLLTSVTTLTTGSSSDDPVSPTSPTMPFLGSVGPFFFPQSEPLHADGSSFGAALPLNITQPLFSLTDNYNPFYSHWPTIDSTEYLHSQFLYGSQGSLLLPVVPVLPSSQTAPSDNVPINMKQYLRRKLLEKLLKRDQPQEQTSKKTKRFQGTKHVTKVERDKEILAKQQFICKATKMKNKNIIDLKYQQICFLESENAKLKEIMTHMNQEFALFQNFIV